MTYHRKVISLCGEMFELSSGKSSLFGGENSIGSGEVSICAESVPLFSVDSEIFIVVVAAGFVSGFNFCCTSV